MKPCGVCLQSNIDVVWGKARFDRRPAHGRIEIVNVVRSLVLVLSLVLGIAFQAAAQSSVQSPAVPPAGLSQQQFDSLVEAISNSVSEKLKAEGAGAPAKLAAPAPAASDSKSKAKAPPPPKLSKNTSKRCQKPAPRRKTSRALRYFNDKIRLFYFLA